MLIANPQGHYRFLQGIEPYSCGVIAAPGHEIHRAILEDALPWRAGFERIEAHLLEQGLARVHLCGVELRSPAPFSMSGFIAFNQTYCQVLRGWDLYVGDLNPVARTNVAPQHDPPEAPALHAFTYTVPSAAAAPTLVVAGAGELIDGSLVESAIIRRGDTRPDAMVEKARYVVAVMAQRLQGLGAGWDRVSAVDVYTVHGVDRLAGEVILPALGPARRHGLRWHAARPPVVDIEFEMDLRGVRSESVV